MVGKIDVNMYGLVGYSLGIKIYHYSEALNLLFSCNYYHHFRLSDSCIEVLRDVSTHKVLSLAINRSIIIC
ncbi:MAG: hypothetical protein ACI901_000632 [Octadecabacter sp.]|jgi:hypothetical protein